MPQLMIHAGPPKTGSTSLQVAFADPRSRLGGWVYPQIGRIPGYYGQHNIFYDAALRKRHRPDVSGMAEFLGLLGTGQDVLLSSEDVPLWQAGLRSCIQPAIERGYRVSILFFVRDPIARMNSIYTQQIKTFAHNMDFGSFVARVRQERIMYPFTRVSRIIQRAGATPILMPFLPDRLGQIYSRVQSRLEIELAIDPDRALNPGPSYFEIALCRELGERLRGRDYRDVLAQAADRWGDGRKFLGFDDELFEETRALFAHEYSRENCGQLDCLADEFHDALFTGKERHDPQIDPVKYAACAHHVRTKLELEEPMASDRALAQANDRRVHSGKSAPASRQASRIPRR